MSNNFQNLIEIAQNWADYCDETEQDEAVEAIEATIEAVKDSPTQVLVTLPDRSQVIVQCAAIVGDPTVMFRESPSDIWEPSWSGDHGPHESCSFHLGEY